MKINHILSLAALVLLFSCSSEEPPPKEKIRPVKSMIIGESQANDGRGFPGVSKEAIESSLSFKVRGTLKTLNVKEGAAVKKGALVAEIDPRDYLVDLDSKKARYEQTKAEAERYYNLWQKGSVAKNDYDRKLANAQQSEAAYRNAQNALKDTKLYAPYDGFFGTKLAEIGEEVHRNQGIVKLVDLSVIEINTTIPEQMAVQFMNFESYEVEFETYPGIVFPATLKELEKKPTPEGFPLHLILNHKNDPNNPEQRKVSAGMSCRVSINLKKDDVASARVIIPVTAIIEDREEGGPSVWVISDDLSLEQRNINIGQFIGNEAIEVVDGLEFGERIVTAGAQRLNADDKVKLLESI